MRFVRHKYLGTLLLAVIATTSQVAHAQQSDAEAPVESTDAEVSAYLSNVGDPVQTIVDLSLQECAQRAITRWGGKAGARPVQLDYRIAMVNARRHQIFFDNSWPWSPVFNANIAFDRTVEGIPVATFDPRGRFSTTGVSGGIGIKGRTPIGLRYDLSLTSGVRWTTLNSGNLSPQYRNSLQATLTQPFARGGGLDYQRKLGLQNKADQKAAWAEAALLRDQALVVVTQAYWSLWSALRNAEMARTMVKWVEAILKVLEQRLKRQRTTMSRLVEAQTALAGLKQSIFTNEWAAIEAEKVLYYHIYKPKGPRPQGSELMQALRPTDEPALVQETRSVDELIAVAFQKNPQIEQYRQKIEFFRHKSNVAHNESRPRVDLKVQAGTGSLVGESTFGLPGHELVIVPPPDAAIGDFGDAWGRQMWIDGLPFVNASLEVELPLHGGERTWKAKQADDDLIGWKEGLLALREDIAIDVRDMVLRHRVMRDQLAAAQAFSETVWRELSHLQKEFKAGQDNSWELLQVLEQWGQARQGLNNAMVQYEVVYAQFLATLGDLTHYLGLKLPDNDRPAWETRNKKK